MKISQNISSFEPLFWDMNFAELDSEKDAFIIIKRIILKGGRKERLRMFEIFEKEKIEEVVLKSREIPNNLKNIYLLAIKNAGS